ncbi:hypothetical protein EWM62_03930 [Mucilaginibacter terrigena]|uniref:DUF4136 domain-containing protein n=1 Tax=Mucilaginibacter terrigena TaxID=2492395 RepID=A0A4Q5LNZ5_9SPHI|nr:hypothetical protein [Mucilaginibacter terrigena]RYU91097.1 hypothetical protein EWM62_03930 [Mucilaginibacter terrigena]
MKKIFITIALSIITVINCHAQSTHTSEFVKISLPNGVYKINKQQVDALPGRLKLQTKSKTDYSPPYNYKADNILVSFFNVNQDSIHNDLARTKRFNDDGYGVLKKYNNNTYTSVIKNTGNKQILVVNYVLHNKGYYSFYIQNEAKTLTQAGRMEYPEADAAKAETLLTEIINNIQFTK